MKSKSKYEEALERAKRGLPIDEVFPELKESEDERIRKWLIEMVEEIRKANPNNAEHNGNCSEAISYLEKQKEQKESEDEKIRKELISFLRTGQPYFCPNTNKRTEWANWVERQKEQKPAEWSEEDEKVFNGVIDTIKDAIAECDCDDVGTKARIIYEKELKWLETRLKSPRLQAKLGWRHYMWNINMRFNYSALVQYDDNQDFEIVFAGNRPKREVSGNYIFLKDICPQPHWKPSEEQMRALKVNVDRLIMQYPGNEIVLKSLYDDLQKLIDFKN